VNLKTKSHELKIFPKYFRDVKRGVKKFELRKNDRGYAIGDYVKLCEYDGESYTGEFLWVKITYILRYEEVKKFGLLHGYCIFGFEEKRN
jgi:ASC-1-like (ASCH) protein